MNFILCADTYELTIELKIIDLELIEPNYYEFLWCLLSN
jgi:hypothetical protein